MTPASARAKTGMATNTEKDLLSTLYMMFALTASFLPWYLQHSVTSRQHL